MMSSTLVILLSVTMVAILSAEAFTLPRVCNSDLSEVPPKVRKVCVALAKLLTSDAGITELIDDYRVLQEIFPRSQLDDHVATKRQDVDHVFLRFGKRR